MQMIRHDLRLIQTRGVDPAGRRYRYVDQDARFINFVMILTAAFGIFVPGPYTSTQPTCLNSSQ